MVLLVIVFFLLGNIKNIQLRNLFIMGSIFLLTDAAGMIILTRRRHINIGYIAQLLPFSFIVALFWDLSILSKYTNKTYIIFLIIGAFVFNYFFVELLVIYLKTKPLKKLGFYLKAHLYLIMIAIVYLACVSTSLRGWLGLDGVIYYQSIREIRSWNFIDLFSLQMCGHISQGYSIFALIGEYLFPNRVIGVRIINIFLALVAILAFSKIVEKMCRNASQIAKAGYTSIFAFSPMVLGMVHEINLDFPMLCFFTCMVAAYLYDKEIWMTVFSILLCFSKEPGVILYGMFIIGILTGRLFTQLKERKRIIPASLISKDIIVLAYSGVLWISLYLGSTSKGWTANARTTIQGNAASERTLLLNTFALDIDYIIVRLKEMFFINFSWLIVLTALVGILFIRRNKDKQNDRSHHEYVGILFSFFGFLGYNCLYITWIHYRYLMILAFFISFLYVFVHARILKFQRSRLLINFILAGVLLCSNFLTFDPVSIRNFNYFDTGKTTLIIPCVMSRNENWGININRQDMPGGDINNAAFYNLEWDYFGMGFNQMLAELEYDENKMILIHGGKDRINCFFGIYSKLTDALYWDNSNKTLNINTYNIKNEGEDYQYFNVAMIENVAEISDMDLSKYEEVYLIDFPINEKINLPAENGYRYLEKFEYGMWAWEIYKVK